MLGLDHQRPWQLEVLGSGIEVLKLLCVPGWKGGLKSTEKVDTRPRGGFQLPKRIENKRIQKATEFFLILDLFSPVLEELDDCVYTSVSSGLEAEVILAQKMTELT